MGGYGIFVSLGINKMQLVYEECIRHTVFPSLELYAFYLLCEHGDYSSSLILSTSYTTY